MVLGSLHAGMGHTHVNHVLSTMNVPTISHSTYKTREREVGCCVEAVVKESCKKVICEEKKYNQIEKDGVVEMAASYDMGWQKRGKGHNSSTGHGAAMGLTTGKVMDYATRCKNCRICAQAKSEGKVPQNHDCRKNHAGSSKSMESSVACELWNKAPLYQAPNTQFTIGDDDTTTLSQMQEKVPYGVEKWSDITHAKRSLTTRLYNISQHNKFNNCSPLTQKVINYVSKCFSYSVAQNKGKPSQLKKSLSQIIPHSFGDHTSCTSLWCRFKDNPTTYTNKDVPHGRDLYGDKLKKLLTELFNKYCTDTVVSKLAPCANSQRNESLNSVIGTTNPKTRYYGGSESSDFRVACGIAQVNIGYGYINNTLER